MNGQSARNDASDKTAWYVWSMRGADVIGLLGAGAAFKEIKATNAMVRAPGKRLSGS